MIHVRYRLTTLPISNETMFLAGELEDGAAVLGVLNVAERFFKAKVHFRRILGEVEFESAFCPEDARVAFWFGN